MKQYGFVYDNFEKMRSFVRNNNIAKYDNLLIQIFTGIADMKFARNIIHEILSILPQAEIIGATTDGEIFKKRSISRSTVVSITAFERAKVKSKLLNCDDNERELGINIAKEFVEDDTKVVILFSDGLLSNGFDVIKAIQSANGNVIIIGGKAADNGQLKETFVFTKDGITRNGTAAVSLTGKQLNVTTDYSFGWSTVGKSMTVTEASDNRIYTIDNIKIVDIYRKYLGDEVAKGLPRSADEFPLIVEKNGTYVAKVPYDCGSDGSLSFLSDIETNDKVRFGYRNINMLLDKSMEIYDKLSRRNIEALFIYSCYVRKVFMQENVNLEIEPLSDIAPTFGFFTYGEFFTIDKSNKLLNGAMTILGISEGGQNPPNGGLPVIKKGKADEKFLKQKNVQSIKAFMNLIDASTKELQEANRVLEEQKHRAEQLNSITKAILQMNSEMISSCELDKFIQMIFDKIFDVITKGRMGNILLVENNRLHYKAYRGYIFDDAKMKDITYDSESIYKYNIGDLFNPVILKNVENHTLFRLGKYNSWKDLLIEKPKEILACGIGIDGQVVGIIVIFNTYDDGNFDEDDKNVLKYICYDMALALKNFKLLENILHMSRYDSLTGVYNRGYFKELLRKVIDDSKISGTTFTICWLDLNDFKAINDTYGHNNGDKALIKFVSTFKTEIGRDDILGRIGGDEFAVIFVNKNKKQVMKTISKIGMALNNCDLELNGHKINIDFAYGLSEFLSDSDDIDELLKIADKMMYEKKRNMKS